MIAPLPLPPPAATGVPAGTVCAFAGQVSPTVTSPPTRSEERNTAWDHTKCAADTTTDGNVPRDDEPIVLIEAQGWMLCDGRYLGVARFPALFGALGYLYGQGEAADGESTFRIPDYRGLFLRGVDDGAGMDPDAAERTGPQGSGKSSGVGSLECDALQDHTHLYTAFDQAVAGKPPTAGGTPNPQAQETEGPIEPGSGGTPIRVSTETRPKNIYVNYIIKYTAEA